MLHLLITLFLAAVFGAAGAFEARRIVANHPGVTLETAHTKARYLLPLILLSLVPLVLFSIPQVWRLVLWRAPVWLDCYALPLRHGVLAALFGFLFANMAFMAAYTAHPKRRSLALASILIVLVIPLLQWQYSRSVLEELGPPKISRGGIVLQTSGTSCAAASGANIARILGADATEKEMAVLMNTSLLTGTTAGQAIMGMRSKGVECVKLENTDIRGFAAPAMLFVDFPSLGPESHAVAFMGLSEGQAEIWDPMAGKRMYSLSSLGKIWHGKGLECSRNLRTL